MQSDNTRQTTMNPIQTRTKQTNNETTNWWRKQTLTRLTNVNSQQTIEQQYVTQQNNAHAVCETTTTINTEQPCEAITNNQLTCGKTNKAPPSQQIKQATPLIQNPTTKKSSRASNTAENSQNKRNTAKSNLRTAVQPCPPIIMSRQLHLRVGLGLRANNPTQRSTNPAIRKPLRARKRLSASCRWSQPPSRQAPRWF